MKPSLHGDKSREYTQSPLSGLKVGLGGTFDGVSYEIKGRVKYKGWDSEDTWYWEEWYLETSSESAWIEYDEGVFTFFKKIEPYRSAEPLDKLRVGDYVEFEEFSTLRVTEKDFGKITEVEGYLPWKATIGEHINYADANSNGKSYSVEWDETSVEYYKGTSLTAEQVYTNFQQKDLLVKSEKRKLFTKGIMSCSIFVFLFGCVHLVSGVWAQSAGTYEKVGDTTSAMLQNETGPQFSLGSLSAAGRPYSLHVSVPVSAGRGNWVWSEVEINNSNGELTHMFSDDFWNEEGESKHNKSFTFLPVEEGAYSITLTGETSPGLTPTPIHIDLEKGIVVSRYFYILSAIHLMFAYWGYQYTQTAKIKSILVW